MQEYKENHMYWMKLHDNAQDKNFSIISLSEEHSYIGVIENTAATNNNKSPKNITICPFIILL